MGTIFANCAEVALQAEVRLPLRVQSALLQQIQSYLKFRCGIACWNKDFIDADYSTSQDRCLQEDIIYLFSCLFVCLFVYLFIFCLCVFFFFFFIEEQCQLT
jgi:hypothetical protein